MTKLVDKRWQSNAVCQYCGQKVYLRRGVLLSPRRADIFDAIERQSKYGGVRSDVLIGMFGRAVKVHISDINKLLAPKGWRIVCEREGSARGFYRIRRGRREETKATDVGRDRAATPSERIGNAGAAGTAARRLAASAV